MPLPTSTPLSTFTPHDRSRPLPRLPRPWTFVAVIAIGVLAFPEPQAAAQTWRDEAFLAGLRDRRLFELAAAHCARRAADRSLTTVERGELTVDWIRTLADHARHAPAAQREALLRQVPEIASQFTAAFPEHSLVFLVRTQEAIANATAGELARLEADASPDPEAARGAARKLSRAAATQLEQLDRQLSEYLPARFRRGTPPDELSVEQLASLQHQIRLQAARAYRGLALAYDEASDDWLAALGRGLQLLDPSLRQLTPEMPLFAPATLEAATQLRLLGRVDAARGMLARLTSDTAPPKPTLTPALLWAVRAEQLRAAVGQRRWREAATMAASQPAQPAADADAATADWDFARFESLIARWQAAATSPNAGPSQSEPPRSEPRQGEPPRSEIDAIRQQAIALLEQIEAKHGPYWKHRGDLLLVRIGAATGTRDADLLGRAADSLLTQDRVDEALRAYEQAASAAAAEQNGDAAFTWAYKAGLLQQRRERHEDAAERLRAAAIAHPQHPQAPLAHLAALWNLAQALRSATPPNSPPNPQPPAPPPPAPTLPHSPRTEPPSAAAATTDTARVLAAAARSAGRYGEWLEDHPQRWPDSPTSSDARVWLGAWLEARGAWRAASDAYRAVPESHTAAIAARRGWLRADLRRLDTAVEAAAPSAGAVPAGAPARLPESPAAVGADIEAALMRPVPDSVASKLADEDRQRSAELLFRALWAQPGREADAARALAAISPPASGTTVETLRDRLVFAQRLRAATADATRRAALAPLALSLVAAVPERDTRAPSPATPDAVARDSRDAMPPIAFELWAAVEAAALEDSGQQPAAIALWRKIAAASPQSGAAQQAFAEALERGGRREDWQAALEQWRRVAAKSPPRSERWFRAKLGAVQQLVRLDQRPEAEKLVRFLIESPPALPAPWRTRLEAAVAPARNR